MHYFTSGFSYPAWWFWDSSLRVGVSVVHAIFCWVAYPAIWTFQNLFLHCPLGRLSVLPSSGCHALWPMTTCVKIFIGTFFLCFLINVGVVNMVMYVWLYKKPQMWLYNFTFPPAVYEFQLFSPTCDIVSLFNFSYSGKCVVILLDVYFLLVMIMLYVFWCAYVSSFTFS